MSPRRRRGRPATRSSTTAGRAAAAAAAAAIAATDSAVADAAAAAAVSASIAARPRRTRSSTRQQACNSPLPKPPKLYEAVSPFRAAKAAVAAAAAAAASASASAAASATPPRGKRSEAAGKGNDAVVAATTACDAAAAAAAAAGAAAAAEPSSARSNNGVGCAQSDDSSSSSGSASNRSDGHNDLALKRLQARSRLRQGWERIFEKYGRNFDNEADEIDVHTGKIVVDRGHLRSQGILLFGDASEGGSGGGANSACFSDGNTGTDEEPGDDDDDGDGDGSDDEDDEGGDDGGELKGDQQLMLRELSSKRALLSDVPRIDLEAIEKGDPCVWDDAPDMDGEQHEFDGLAAWVGKASFYAQVPPARPVKRSTAAGVSPSLGSSGAVRAATAKAAAATHPAVAMAALDGKDAKTATPTLSRTTNATSGISGGSGAEHEKGQAEAGAAFALHEPESAKADALDRDAGAASSTAHSQSHDATPGYSDGDPGLVVDLDFVPSNSVESETDQIASTQNDVDLRTGTADQDQGESGWIDTNDYFSNSRTDNGVRSECSPPARTTTSATPKSTPLTRSVPDLPFEGRESASPRERPRSATHLQNSPQDWSDRRAASSNSRDQRDRFGRFEENFEHLGSRNETLASRRSEQHQAAADAAQYDRRQDREASPVGSRNRPGILRSSTQRRQVWTDFEPIRDRWGGSSFNSGRELYLTPRAAKRTYESFETSREPTNPMLFRTPRDDRSERRISSDAQNLIRRASEPRMRTVRFANDDEYENIQIYNVPTRIRYYEDLDNADNRSSQSLPRRRYIVSQTIYETDELPTGDSHLSSHYFDSRLHLGQNPSRLLRVVDRDTSRRLLAARFQQLDQMASEDDDYSGPQPVNRRRAMSPRGSQPEISPTSHRQGVRHDDWMPQRRELDYRIGPRASGRVHQEARLLSDGRHPLFSSSRAIENERFSELEQDEYEFSRHPDGELNNREDLANRTPRQPHRESRPNTQRVKQEIVNPVKESRTNPPNQLRRADELDRLKATPSKSDTPLRVKINGCRAGPSMSVGSRLPPEAPKAFAVGRENALECNTNVKLECDTYKIGSASPAACQAGRTQAAEHDKAATNRESATALRSADNFASASGRRFRDEGTDFEADRLAVKQEIWTVPQKSPAALRRGVDSEAVVLKREEVQGSAPARLVAKQQAPRPAVDSILVLSPPLPAQRSLRDTAGGDSNSATLARGGPDEARSGSGGGPSSARRSSQFLDRPAAVTRPVVGSATASSSTRPAAKRPPRSRNNTDSTQREATGASFMRGEAADSDAPSGGGRIPRNDDTAAAANVSPFIGKRSTIGPLPAQTKRPARPPPLAVNEARRGGWWWWCDGDSCGQQRIGKSGRAGGWEPAARGGRAQSRL
ncbi:hypothetical protein DFJ73DRAFT_796182 [Zopfochytrium polystomum]|nr:hypothetical protein DFJ73DRAFT_796182 [Zopfochytrium polystomum]